MHFADATLVTRSEVQGARTVITTDRRGFAAHRNASGQAFEVPRYCRRADRPPAAAS